MGDVRWTLITVTYNSSEALRRFWNGDLPADVEWVVVDNASQDGSAEVARSLGARVIALDVNLGFGGANNIGYRASDAPYVAFVNPDIAIDPESLSVLEASLTREDGLVSPQLIYSDGSVQPGGRTLPSLSNKVINRLLRTDLTSDYFVIAQPGEERYVAWAIGAAVAAKRSTFELLGDGGPWDELFFIYYEDSDIALRSWTKGLTVRVTGDARWTHGWARETKKLSLGPWKRELASMSRFYRRYPALVFGKSGGKAFSALSRSVWGTVVDGSSASRPPDTSLPATTKGATR